MLDRYAHASVADLPTTLQAWDWSGGRGMLLHGPKGTGKTHAAVALWRDWQHRHQSSDLVIRHPFVSVARLMQEKRRKMDADTGWQEPSWKSVEFVVFDDWDKCRWSDWVAEEMFTIIDTLYCRCVPVIVTSNLSPREFARHSGEYIADRLKEMVVPVPMDGPSRRNIPNVAPTGSHATHHAHARNGQSSSAHGDDARSSHQPQPAAGSDGALSRVGAAQDGVGHPSDTLTEHERAAAEAQLHVLLAHARQQG